MRISAVTSTLLFRGTAARPRQIVQVTVVNDDRRPGRPATVTVAGAGISHARAGRGDRPLPPGGEHVAEVAIEVAGAPGRAPRAR